MRSPDSGIIRTTIAPFCVHPDISFFVKFYLGAFALGFQQTGLMEDGELVVYRTIEVNRVWRVIYGDSGTDTLTGGDGRDTFVLGEAGNVFYLGYGFAQIIDFNANTDTIQLAGVSSFYSLFENPVSGSVSISIDNGNGVFDAGDDLIASVSISRGTFSSADHLIFA